MGVNSTKMRVVSGVFLLLSQGYGAVLSDPCLVDDSGNPTPHCKSTTKQKGCPSSTQEWEERLDTYCCCDCGSNPQHCTAPGRFEVGCHIIFCDFHATTEAPVVTTITAPMLTTTDFSNSTLTTDDLTTTTTLPPVYYHSDTTASYQPSTPVSQSTSPIDAGNEIGDEIDTKWNGIAIGVSLGCMVIISFTIFFALYMKPNLRAALLKLVCKASDNDSERDDEDIPMNPQSV